MRGALLLKLPFDEAEADAKLASILLPRYGMLSSR